LGSLILPPSGTIYIDTSILIYTVEKIPDYYTLLIPLWKASSTKEIDIITSELTLMETLVGPLKKGNVKLADTYEEILLNTEIRLFPISISILKKSADLRARINIRTPDAIHVSTALEGKCDMFLTNDYNFQKIPTLPVTILEKLK